jgi:hypothetical protein
MSEIPPYQGHTITLTADYTFAVSGPLLDAQFSAFAAAKAAIEEAIIIDAKAKRRAANNIIPMLDDTGNAVTVKGIHAGTGKLLGAPDGETVLYPRVPWVAEVLKAREALRQQAAELSRKVNGLDIRVSRAYGRQTLAKYDEIIARLDQEVAEKTALASERQPANA